MNERGKTNVPKRLGDLESEIMGIVWQEGEVTVQDVQAALLPTRELAYTTIMTVLSRLAEKGLLERRKQGRAYLYTPVDSQEEVAGSLLRSLVDRFYRGGTISAIAHLLETEDEVDDAELERLEALVRAKRQERDP